MGKSKFRRKDRQTDRQLHRQTDAQSDRQMHRYTHRQMQRQTDRDRCKDVQTDKSTLRCTDRLHTDRLMTRQIKWYVSVIEVLFEWNPLFNLSLLLESSALWHRMRVQRRDRHAMHLFRTLGLLRSSHTRLFVQAGIKLTIVNYHLMRK